MFSDDIINAAKAHALAEFPKESCGLVFHGAYLPFPNVAEEPTKTFRMQTTMALLEAEAVIHSHPFEEMSALPSSPSADDIRGQISTGLPWGVIDNDGTNARDPYFFGDFLLDEPLLGSQYQHGVRDCLLGIRKWYWQKRQVKLADYPRDDMWWTKEDAVSLYIMNFEKWGFKKITVNDLKDGDVILGKINSPVINHAAVFLDNAEDGRGLIYHHLPNRLSRREAANPYISRAELFVRYVGAD